MTFVYGMLAMWLVIGAIILISDCMDSGGFWVREISWATGIVMAPYLVVVTLPCVLVSKLRRFAVCRTQGRGKDGRG